MSVIRQNPPADPRFAQAIEKGFELQAMEYENQLATMRQHRDLAEKRGKEPSEEFELYDGVMCHYVPPEIIEEAQESIVPYRNFILEKLHTLDTSSEQRRIVMGVLREAYENSVFRVESAMVPELLDVALDHGYEIYTASNAPMSTAEAQAAELGKLTPINFDAKEFWDTAIEDVHDYADMLIDANRDLCNLAIAYADKHGIPEENNIDSYAALATMRYSSVVGMDDATSDIVTIEDPEKFADIMEKLIRDDLLGPYKDVLAGASAPHLAWFVGRAIEVIEEKQKNTPHHRTPVFKVHDHQSPEGRIPKIYERMKLIGPRVTYEDQIAMMQSESVQQEVKAMLKPIFTRYPNAANDIGQLLSARALFEATHEINKGPGQGL